MSVTEITRVEMLPLDRDRLLGFFVDLPVAAAGCDAYEVMCAGWVLGKTAPALGVELVGNNGAVRRIPTGYPRPDVSLCYPEAADAAVAGWWSPVSVLGMNAEFELTVRALLKDDPRPVPLARIQGRRRTMPRSFEPGIQPLMVTSLGRTGSTWLMQLLAEHPSIVARRAHPYEMWPVRNWMQFLGALTEPIPDAESSGKVESPDAQWRVAHPFSNASLLLAPGMHEFFGRRFVEQASEFFRRCGEDCYREIASLQHQAAPVFFAEKHLPYEVPGIVWELYPAAREIFLVRDFRDMLCSIAAFNQKRGSVGFGRNWSATEDQYVLNLGRCVEWTRMAWNNRRDRACLVRYEDLVSHTTETLARILSYLGLPADDAQIDEMIRRAAVDTPDLEQHRTTPSLRESVGRWRRDLPPELYATCQEAFGASLADFGYADFGHKAESWARTMGQ
jgi:hypothetical protein